MLATLSSLEWEHSNESSKSLADLQLEGLLDTEQVVDDEWEESVDLWWPTTELDCRTIGSLVVEMSKYLETLGSPWKHIGESS